MAKKVSLNAADSFNSYKSFSSHNTLVRIDEKGNASMYLFGNRIAVRIKEGNRLFITTCGWNTVTTRGRLREIIPIRLSVSGGVLRIDNEPWDGRWIEVVEAPPVCMISKNEPPL